MSDFYFLFTNLPTVNMYFFMGPGERQEVGNLEETQSVMWKSQNTKKWEKDANGADDVEGREMKYVSNKEFSKLPGQMDPK